MVIDTATGFTCPPMDPPAATRPVVLFYTDIQRTFRATLAGYLHQLCSRYRVVLLTEELDAETLRLLGDRALFPGLCARVAVGQYGSEAGGLVVRHRRMSHLAAAVIREWRPDAVFAAGLNLFECYLRRFAREAGATAIGCIGLLLVKEPRGVQLLLDLHGAQTRFPNWLPAGLRLALARGRRALAHAACYAIAPLAAGQRPFFGINSIYRLDYTQLDDVDASYVYTAANRDMLVAGGAPAGKLFVIPHPMRPGGADAVWQAYGLCCVPHIPPRGLFGVATCFLDIEVGWGFHAVDLSSISDEEIWASRLEALRAIVDGLPGWEIRIKPHPMSAVSPLYAKVKAAILGALPGIKWVPPADPAERHMLASHAVFGFPPASMALYTSIMLRPGLPVVQVDINRELRGDAYTDIGGVVTADSLDELRSRLAAIRAGDWREAPYEHDAGDFGTLDALVQSSLSQISLKAG